jgi:protein SCO1
MMTTTERRMHVFYRALVAILVTLGILLMPACSRSGVGGLTGDGEAGADHAGAEHATRAPAAGHGHDHGEGAEHVGAAPALTPTGYSLFHLDSEWQDQTGAVRKLESLGGRVQVLTMAYTYCGYACPRLIADMKRIEGSIDPNLAEDVGFVLVSIDPERDTPERLARFAADLHLDPARWTLLTGSPDAVLELAAVLGVRYARESDTEFGHTNLITVLTPTGEIAHRQLGVGEGVPATLDAVRTQVVLVR